MADNETDVSRFPWLQKSWKWAVAATGLPGLYATWLHDFAAQHPLWAGALLAGYWAILTAAGFLWRATKTPVDQARQRISDRLTIATGNILFRHDRRYRAWLLGTLEHIGSTGAFDLESSRPYFDDVYVTVELAETSPLAVPSGVLSEGERPRADRLITELLGHRTEEFLVVLGAAGLGKTTLSQHLARELARRRLEHRGVPILIPLSQWASRITDDSPASLLEIVTADMPDPEGPRSWLRSRLDKGRCVLLADGLDEIPDAETRTAVLRWLTAVRAGRHARNACVLTSRPDSYRETPVTGTAVDVAHLRKLSPQRAERFVRARFAAQPLPDSDRHVNAFLQQVSLPTLTALTVNPLLLTLMITLYRAALDRSDDPDLPDDRVEVYRRICDLLVRRRAVLEMDGERKLEFLRRTAYAMMTMRVTQLDVDDPVFDDDGFPAQPRRFIDALKADGLLTVSRQGAVSFPHKTFQEYLAAAHIHATGLAQVLLDHVGDDGDWWRETTLFFSGLGKYRGRAAGEPILQACLELRFSAAAMSLALAVHEHGRGIPESLGIRLFQVIDDAADAEADPEYRRVIARALLDNRLDQPVPRPITARIYRLFVLDRDGVPIPDAPYPDDLNEPVYAVRATDALDFLAWVDSLVGEAVYRLPTPEEMTDLRTRASAGLLHGPYPHVVTAWTRSSTQTLGRWQEAFQGIEFQPAFGTPLGLTLHYFLYYFRGEDSSARTPATRPDDYPELQPLAALGTEFEDPVVTALDALPDGLRSAEGPPDRFPGVASDVEFVRAVLSTLAAATPGTIRSDSAATHTLLLEWCRRIREIRDAPRARLTELVDEFGQVATHQGVPSLFEPDAPVRTGRQTTWIADYRAEVAEMPSSDLDFATAIAVVECEAVPEHRRGTTLTALRVLARTGYDPGVWLDPTRVIGRRPDRDFQPAIDALLADDPDAKLPLIQLLATRASSRMTAVFGRSPAPTADQAAELRDIAVLLAQCNTDPVLVESWIALATAASDVHRRLGDQHPPDEMVILVADD